jgi:hypothetical protein
VLSISRLGQTLLKPNAEGPIGVEMDTRVQRVVLETKRFRVVGELMLPTEGFRTRLSDVLNRQDTGFIPLVNAELTPLEGGETRSLPFVAVSRTQIQIAFEADEQPEGGEQPG